MADAVLGERVVALEVKVDAMHFAVSKLDSTLGGLNETLLRHLTVYEAHNKDIRLITKIGPWLIVGLLGFVGAKVPWITEWLLKIPT